MSAAHGPAGGPSAPSIATAVCDGPWPALLPSLLDQSAEWPSQLASPKLGQAWAAALVAYWSRLQRLGGLDPLQPLYLLDLAPATGQTAACLLPPLRAALRAHGMQDWPLRYLACLVEGDQTDALQAMLATHPVLAPLADAGWLQTAQWPARTGRPLLVGQARLPLFGSRNPVAVVSLGGFSAQPSALHGLHHGRRYEAWLHVQSPQPDAERLELHCEWRAAQARPEAPAAPPSIALLLGRYQEGLPSAAVMLSEEALAQIDAVADFSAGRYLMIAADRGVSSERQMREQAFALPAELPRNGLRLPVNFHALGWHQRMQGASTLSHQPRDAGCVLQLAWRDDALGVDDESFEQLAQALCQNHPDDRLPLAEDDAAGWLERSLRAGGADPAALALHLARGLPRQVQFDPLCAAALSAGLQAAWDQASTRQRAEALAMPLASWWLALGFPAAALRALAALPALPDPMLAAHAHWLRALAEQAGAQPAAALRSVQSVLRLQPGHAEARAMRRRLRASLARSLAHRWCIPDQMHDELLVLELQDEGHAEAIARQLRDPQIAELARLPTPPDGRLPTVDAAGGLPQELVELCVIHREQGLVGGLGFQAAGDAAYFHLWVGADFQGQGLGGRALALLLGLLAAGGIAQVFSSVYSHNARCRRLLARAGFVELPLQGTGDDEDLVHVHRSLLPPLRAAGSGARRGSQARPGLSRGAAAVQLIALCRSLGQPLQLADGGATPQRAKPGTPVFEHGNGVDSEFGPCGPWVAAAAGRSSTASHSRGKP